MGRGLRHLAAAAASFSVAQGYPGKLNVCAAWWPGDDGHMGAVRLTDGGEGSCTISAKQSTSGDPGVTYSVEVSGAESTASLFKLHSSGGDCLGDEMSSGSMVESKTFIAGPYQGAITFHALCSTGFSHLAAATPLTCRPGPADEVICQAAERPSTSTATSTTLTSTASTAPTTTTTWTSTPAAAEASNKVVAASGLALGESGLKLSFEPVGVDSLQIEVVFEGDAWIGLGFSQGSSVSMTGHGRGADVYACAEGELRRHWVTSKRLEAGLAAPGACSFENGRTIMRFTRALAASGGREVAVTPGVPQQLIFARGAAGQRALQRHGHSSTERSGVAVDFGSGREGAAGSPRGEGLLFLHLVFMSAAWGALLPFGATVANRFHVGKWFFMHRAVQATGWAVQLVGFVVAVAYCGAHSVHFGSVHAWLGLLVVLLGTFQPINAFFRPHIHPGEAKSRERQLFERVHKGTGWTAIFLGMLNIIFGVALVARKGYDGTTVGIAVLWAVLCLLVPAGLWAGALARPEPTLRLLRLEAPAEAGAPREEQPSMELRAGGGI